MVGKKELIYGRFSIVLVAIFIMIAFCDTSVARTNVDRTVTINLIKWLNVPINEVKAGEILNVLLMTPSDYADYQAAIPNRGTIKYIADGSVLKKTIDKYTYTFVEGGDYILVFDNTDVPKFGGSPSGQVEMNLKVSVSAPSPTSVITSEPTGDKPYSVAATPTPAPKTSGFEAILAAFVIVTLVLRRR
jgi:hypothetical protein